MEMLELNDDDAMLVTAAKNIIHQHYKYGRHHIGAALRTKSGNIHTGIHIEANVGRISVCAEVIAIGKAILEGDNLFKSIVAVRHSGPLEENQEAEIVSPCGMCRELISDYGDDTLVILNVENRIVKVSISELLPRKFTRRSPPDPSLIRTSM